ncbi:helix-turn-helix domain-containing protein [Streptomyces sp. NPDC059009]|uniref:helix-turn-helix domain-containing protein n=1 Tax=Streptomyces sp. NPDC059009 TaxID=3346694 RepID=UPI00367C3802
MTDFQQARVALGLRLRELRLSRPGGRLTQKQLAVLLNWEQSKISKLETGRQNAAPEDLQAWTVATGHPEAADELLTKQRNIELDVRSWRRQLARGHRPVQETLNAEHRQTRTFHGFQSAMIVGILQTADYARAIFGRYASLQQSQRDIEEAVGARLKRQDALYSSGKRYNILMWEPALHARVCPTAVLAAQLDRLTGIMGLSTVTLGIIPLQASLKIPPVGGFWIYDEHRVITESWHAELWIDDADSVATYLRVWNTLRESAVYGADAHNLINSARRALGSR